MKMKVTDYEFFPKLTALPFVERIWVYGSRARGDYQERSDIDLVIDSPHATSSQWQEVLGILENADTLLKIDCVRLDEIEKKSSFEHRLKEDRVLLFKRKGDHMTDPLWMQNFSDLGEALERLKEILEAPLDEHRFIMDGTIQRFEFCIELFWKNFANFAEMEGKEVLSPRQAISQAYQMKWFDNETLWLEMLKDRNIMSHTYKKVKADAVYERIKTYYPEMKTTYESLKKLYLNKVGE